MVVGFSAGSGSTLRQVMFFIDGGYLRQGFNEIEGSEDFDLLRFPWQIALKFIRGGLRPEIIRTYFYGAICETHLPEYSDQKKYYDELDKIRGVEVKLGSLVKLQSGFRQKGVDVLLAIDVLTKAYQNHYDIAILICGDRDIIPLIHAVKDSTGKRIYGVLFKDHSSSEIEKMYDDFLLIAHDNIKLLKTP